MVVEKGQPLFRVTNLERKHRMGELPPRIADAKELLRIMRTSGTATTSARRRRSSPPWAPG